MINAKEAKELTENIEKYVDDLLEEIEEIIYRCIRNNMYSFTYEVDERKYPFATEYAMIKLKDLGYKVRMLKAAEEGLKEMKQREYNWWKPYRSATIEIRWDND